MDKNTSLVERGNQTSLKERDPLALELRREYENYVPSDDFNIHGYIDVLLRRKWLIIVCLVTSLAIVGITTLRTVPIYQSEAIVELTPEPPRLTSFQEVNPLGVQMYDIEEYYETQYRLLKSRSLGRDVVESMGLLSQGEPAVKPRAKKGGFLSYVKQTVRGVLSLDSEAQSSPRVKKSTVDLEEHRVLREEQVISAFISGINVLPDRKSRLVKITYDSPDPAYTAKAVNTLVDTYIQWVMFRKINATKMAREFLTDQVAQIKVKLEKAEIELGNFAKSADIVSLDEELNLVYTQLIDLNKSVSEVEKERIEKESLYAQVKSGSYSYMPIIANDPVVTSLNDQYTSLSAEYQNKSVIYGPNYPAMRQLKAQMARIRREKSSRMSGIVKSIEKDFESAVRREALLKKRAQEQKRRASRLNEESIQYKIHLREVETNNNIYQTLLQRQKETEVTSAIRTTNVMIVDYARVPRFPYKPNMKNNLMYGAFLGFVTGCSLAFMLEFLDNTIKDEEELKRDFSLPLLGSIPLADESELDSLEKIVYLNPRSLIAEAFRVIRTSILYSTPDHAPQAIFVTSSHPLEGKTTTSCNLALSIVQTGLRVLIVDADLRKPRLHKVLLSKGANSVGLSTYLTGNIELGKVIQRSQVKGLDIITSGPVPPNPAELLGSQRLKDLIENLRDQYDQIIFDGPPIAGFADSRLLTMIVDGTLLVTSIGITQRPLFRNCVEEILRVRGKILGTVVNRLVPKRGNKYGYGYYYYSSDERIKGKKKLSLPGRTRFFSG